MDDRRRLERYVQRVEELRSRRMYRDEAGYKYSLNFDSVKGMSVRLDMPDEEDLRSYLVTFRQFISPDEPVFFNGIYNICWNRLESNNRLREKLIEARKDWRQALKNNGIGLRFNEQELSPEAVADLWINGYYFHNDDDKYATLAGAFDSGLGFIKAHFMEFLIQATSLIVYLGHIVAYGLKKSLFRF